MFKTKRRACAAATHQARMSFRAAAFGAASAILAAVAAPAAKAEAPSPTASADTLAGKPAMWRITDADNTLWVFGSVHMLSKDASWRRPELDQALKDAKVVFFELDLSAAATADAQQKTMAVGFNPAGVTLSASLSEEGRARFARMSAKYNFPTPLLERLKPWLASVMVGLIVAESEGASALSGVEIVLYRDIVKAGKKLEALETVEDQLKVFTALSDKDQIALFELTLKQLEDDPDQLKSMFAAWRVGDLVTLEALVVGAIKEAPGAFADDILRRRNVAWADKLQQFMAGSDDGLVVVGAGHMLGEDSLITLMEARGFKAERF